MAPWTLLVAVDFSDCSRAALEAAGRLAADLKARVVLAHAFVNAPRVARKHPDPVSQVKLELTRDEAVELSTEWAARLRKDGLDVEVATGEGNAAQFILETVRDRDPALVVVGTHGRSGLRRAALGSVAEAVLRGADRPVLAVPMPGKGRT